jgi:hypothetical protein
LQHPGISNDSNDATAGSSDVSGYEVVPIRNGTAASKTMLNLPIYLLQLHAPSPDFFGRRDVLQQIKQVLHPPGQKDLDSRSVGLRTFALCGVGGVGKTQVAVQYAYESKDVFDAIFFLQANEAAKLSQAFSDISKAMGLATNAGGANQTVSKDLVLGWLSQPVHELYGYSQSPEPNRKAEPNWLLIFDNADDLTLLRDFWPVLGSGSILITSRDPLAKTRTHVSVSNGLDLEPLDTKTAGSLLRRLTSRDKTTDIDLSENIAHKLSGLPLAISQISGTISRRDLSLEEFSELYDQEALRADFHKTSLETGSEVKTLWTVWSFEDISANATALLGVVAFLDPDQIPEELLCCAKGIDGAKLPAQFPSSLQSFIEARTELLKSSLIKRNQDRREITIHRILQDVTRAKLSETALQTSLESAIELLYHSWPFGEFDYNTKRWPRCEQLVSHVASIRRFCQTGDRFRHLEGTQPKLARLFMDVGW